MSISLSFKIKTMVTLSDRCIGDNVLQKHPLHQNQYAYQTGKSTETTLAQSENTCVGVMKHQ